MEKTLALHKIPQIFISSYADQARKERAEKLKPPAYLIKPIKFEQLKSIMDSALGERSRESR